MTFIATCRKNIKRDFMTNNQDKIEYYLLLLAKLEFPQIENLQQLPGLIEDLKAGRELFAKIRDAQQSE